MHSFSAAIVLCFVAALGGCASAFDKPAANAYYGEPPALYEQSIPEALSLALKDPDSARYKFLPAVKGYQNNGLVYGGRVTWTGYMIVALVNAKNSMGGYTGFEPYTFYFSGERVVSWHKGAPSGPLTHIVEGATAAPVGAPQPGVSASTPQSSSLQPALSKAQWQQQQLDELAKKSIPYEQYQQEYRRIMGQ